MRLSNRHFFYPEEMPAAQVVDRIKRCLRAATANQDVWADERFDWQNFIQRECWLRGVHPVWPLVSLQRERSLLGDPGSERDFDFAEGVVGQDVAGTANITWNGLPAQILLCIRAAAWSANIGSRANFGYRPGLWPQHSRWGDRPQNTVQLYDRQSKPTISRIAGNEAEYIQLQFTPHLEVLDLNGGIYQARVASFFE